MKIALITEYSEIGGGESNLLNLAQELNLNHEVTLFCTGKVLIEAQKKAIQVRDFRTKKRWISFVPFVSLNKRLISELNNYDIVHAYSVNCVPILFFVKTKKVWTTHGYWEKAKGLRAFVISKIINSTICVSTDVYNCTKIMKKEKIFLGTSFGLGNPLQKKEVDSRNISIVCVGRFQEIKGQDLLVKALQMITTSEINFDKLTLHFVGDVNGNDQSDILFKKSVVELSKVINNDKIKIIFEGFKNNVRDYIEQADLVVIPSRYESFSMVAIEALSCGKPVIAPNIAGPKDIVNSEDIGQLFSPGEVDSLKDKIVFSLQNLESFSIKKCIERASFFSVKNQANKHIEFYKKVINE